MYDNVYLAPFGRKFITDMIQLLGSILPKVSFTSDPINSGRHKLEFVFDQTAHFGRSDRNVPFHLTKLFTVPSTALLHPAYNVAYNNNNQTRGGLGRVCVTGMCRSIGHVDFINFKPEFLLNGKRPM